MEQKNWFDLIQDGQVIRGSIMKLRILQIYEQKSWHRQVPFVMER